MIIWATQSARAAAQTLANPTSFLAPEECDTLATLRFPKRRRDWLLGRLTLKRLVAHHTARRMRRELPLSQIIVERDPSGAPCIRGADSAFPAGCVSLSHSCGVAVAALCDAPNQVVGVDLERIEQRHPSFASDFLSDEERITLLETTMAHDLLVTTLWSAKEAAVKALRVGLAIDTRRLTCRIHVRKRGWASLEMVADRHDTLPGLEALTGAWRRYGDFVLTVAHSRSTGVHHGN